MDYATQRENLNKSIEVLQREQIDIWIIFTSEGNDPCLPYVTGVETVGPGAFLISRSHGKIVVCSTIDAQDIIECGLFDEVRTYHGDLDEVLKSTVKGITPMKIVVNYSENYPLADGLTTGRFRMLQQILQDVYPYEYYSSENIIKNFIS